VAPAGLLSEARLFDLEASLQRDLRLFEDALASLDRALSLTAEGASAGRLYLKRSSILEQQGDHEGSLEALRAAMPRIDERTEPRLYGSVLFNLCANLVDLSRLAEASEVLPQVRERFVAHGKDFELVRLLWLEGKIHEGLGRTELAIAAIDQVRRDFTSRRKLDDAALAGLDLAALYLEVGRTAETRDLARQMAKVFGSLRIKREELAAVRLFVEAAEQEVATVELARRAAAAIRAVRRAREADDFRV
jgi:tetratricopeptide (TPR) repeat protein